MLSDIFMELKVKNWDDLVSDLTNSAEDAMDYWRQLDSAIKKFNKEYSERKAKKTAEIKFRPQNWAPKSQEGVYTLRVHNKYMVLEHNGKSVHCACDPEDKFDMMKGFELLLKRLKDDKQS